MVGLKQTALALSWQQWLDMGGCRLEGQVAFKAISTLALNDEEWGELTLETIVKASPAADEFLSAFAVKDPVLAKLVINDKSDPIAFNEGTRVIIKTNPWKVIGKDPRDRASLKGRHGEILALNDQEFFVRTDNGACVWVAKDDLDHEVNYEAPEMNEKNPPDLSLSFGVFNPEDIDNWRYWFNLASRSLKKCSFFIQDPARRDHVKAMASELDDISKAFNAGWKTFTENYPMASMMATLHSMEQFIDYKEARSKDIGVKEIGKPEQLKDVGDTNRPEVAAAWHNKPEIRNALDKLSMAVGPHCLRIQDTFDIKAVHTVSMSARELNNWILLGTRGEKGFVVGGPGAMKVGNRIKEKMNGKYNEYIPGFIFNVEHAAKTISKLADVVFESKQK